MYADLYTIGYGAGSCTEYAQTRTAVKSIRRARTFMQKAFRLPSRARTARRFTGAELQRLDLTCRCARLAAGWAKYLVGQCIAHGVPVRYYGKVVSVCG